MGIECAARDGIHVWDDHYLAEIIDPATARRFRTASGASWS